MADSHLITDPAERASIATDEIAALLHGVMCIIETDIGSDDVTGQNMLELLYQASSRNAAVRDAVQTFRAKPTVVKAA